MRDCSSGRYAAGNNPALIFSQFVFKCLRAIAPVSSEGEEGDPTDIYQSLHIHDISLIIGPSVME